MKTVSDNADFMILGFGDNIPDGLEFPFAIDMRKYDKVAFVTTLTDSAPLSSGKVQLFCNTGLGTLPEVLVKESDVIQVDGVQPDDPIYVIIEAKAENLPPGKTHYILKVDVLGGALNIGCAALAFDPHHRFQNIGEKDVVLKAWE